MREHLLKVYRLLLNCYGPQHWWPGETPFEVMVGAILTQSAAWINVEKAINNLKSAGALSPDTIRMLSHDKLASLIYPSGYYNAKSHKLKAMARWLGENFKDDPSCMFTCDVGELRKSLLAVHGIGAETADSIILYAACKPIFVIDAYTQRILMRLEICPLPHASTEKHRNSYATFQSLFMDNLPLDAAMFNEYHALFVRHGKDICRKKPLCQRCCLKDSCPYPVSYSIVNSV